MHRCYPECRPGHHVHKEYVSSTPSNAPNPGNYEIEDVQAFGDYVLLLVRYPGCTTYKGKKLLVVRATMKQLLTTKRLDPHFTETLPSSGIRVVARFAPDDEGVELAKALITHLTES